MDGVGVIMEEKIDLLENIITNSKTFEFVEDEILNIKDYYTGRKSININFTALIELMRSYEDIDFSSILMYDNEIEENDSIF